MKMRQKEGKGGKEREGKEGKEEEEEEEEDGKEGKRERRRDGEIASFFFFYKSRLCDPSDSQVCHHNDNNSYSHVLEYSHAHADLQRAVFFWGPQPH